MSRARRSTPRELREIYETFLFLALLILILALHRRLSYHQPPNVIPIEATTVSGSGDRVNTI